MGTCDGSPDVPTSTTWAYAGTTRSIRTNSAVSTWVPSMPVVNLNRYRRVSFAVRTDIATGLGIDFKIRNKTTGTEFWFVYELGTGVTTGPDSDIPRRDGP